MEELDKTAGKPTTDDTSRDDSWDVLLSYASEDAGWLKALEVKLKDLHLTTFDPHAIPAEFWGENRDDVVSAVFPAKCAVAFIVLSSAYISSDQNKRELAIIVEAAPGAPQSLLLPARLDNSPVPEVLGQVAILDAQSGTPDSVARTIVGRIRAWEKTAPGIRPASASPESAQPATIGELLRNADSEVGRLRRILPGVDAEDIVQEALFLTFNAIRKNPGEQPWRYFNALVRQIALRHLNKMRRPQDEFAPSLERGRFRFSGSPTSNVLEQREEAAVVQQAFKDLPPLDREIIEAMYLQEFSTEDAAELLGISPAVVRVRHYRALSRLRELMNARS
ncbi:MAG: sigma-70 family RNA polymerase sigma factor [Gemmatimonadota bacterium]|nr:sigma-70 family RNA polymerase sigma factor [Gemmatimonadota bacterium]